MYNENYTEVTLLYNENHTECIFVSHNIYACIYTTVYSDCISIVEGKYIHTDNVMKWIIIVMRIVSLIKIKSRGTRTLH